MSDLRCQLLKVFQVQDGARSLHLLRSHAGRVAQLAE